VVRTRVGYAGGTKADPTYQDLGDHAESLQVDYDPARISYETLLDAFWSSHDPTRPPGSGQYGTALFVEDEGQRRAAETSRDALAAGLGAAVRTPIVPLGRFYRAEDYHQKYRLRNSPLMASFRALCPTDREFTDSTAAARVNAHLDGELGLESLREELAALGLRAEGDGRRCTGVSRIPEAAAAR